MRIKKFSVTEPSTTNAHDAGEAIINLLRRSKPKARFVTELHASLRRSKISGAETGRTLAQLEADGAIMIRDHFCADPHLVGTDLRVIALVESVDGADPQLSAIRAIDETWNKWLNEYLANHRCG